MAAISPPPRLATVITIARFALLLAIGADVLGTSLVEGVGVEVMAAAGVGEGPPITVTCGRAIVVMAGWEQGWAPAV